MSDFRLVAHCVKVRNLAANPAVALALESGSAPVVLEGQAVPSELAMLWFESAHQVAVRALILAGLVERWSMLDPSRNRDLEDLAISYRDADLLVALYHNRVVGCGACIPRSPRLGELVRMSVTGDLRGRGIGKALLQRLCTRAEAAGYTRLVLETTASWHDAISFYQRSGFQITHYQDGDVYMALDLEPSYA